MSLDERVSGSRLQRGIKHDLLFELAGEQAGYPIEVDEVDSGDTRIICPKNLGWLNRVPIQFILRCNVAMDNNPIFSNRADGIMRPEGTTYDHDRSKVPAGQIVSHPITRDGVLELMYHDDPTIVRVSFLHTLGGRMLE